MGVGAAIVHVEELTERTFRTALTLAVVFGGLGAAVGVLLANPITAFLAAPEARSVVIGQSLTLPLLAVSGVLGGVLRRRFQYRALALSEVLSYGLGFLVVGLFAARSGAGPMSLVIAMAVSSIAVVVQAACVHQSLGLGFHRPEATALLRFGGRVAAISLFEAFTTNADILAVGRFGGVAPAGQYNRANQLAGARCNRESQRRGG